MCVLTTRANSKNQLRKSRCQRKVEGERGGKGRRAAGKAA